jgi:hypothetical protein
MLAMQHGRNEGSDALIMALNFWSSEVTFSISTWELGRVNRAFEGKRKGSKKERRGMYL